MTPAAQNRAAQNRDAAPERRAAEQRFIRDLTRALRREQPLSAEELAQGFEEDGHLGSEMRALLLDRPRTAA